MSPRTLSGVLALCASLLGLAFSPAGAEAAVAHQFLAQTSEELDNGVPAGCGTGQAEPPCISGPLSGVSALTTDSEGRLWVAERIETGKNLGKSRVDAFDDQSGSFAQAGTQAPQLDEEGGVLELDNGVAVGHPGGEREVYVGAAQTAKNVVAVFGPSGRLQHTWNGEHTPNKSFDLLRGVAVDGSGSPETQGDVYVATAGTSQSENVVDVFAGQAGGEEPEKTIAQLSGTPENTGICEGKGLNAPCPFSFSPDPKNPATISGVAISPANGDVLVADGNREACSRGEAKCVVDVFEPGMLGVYSFAFAIKEAPGQPFIKIGPMAVDGNGDIYVVEKAANVVDQFDAEGGFLTQLSRTPQGPFKPLQSIAADPSSGDVYVGDFDELLQKTGAIDAFGPSLIVPDVTTTAGEAEVKLGPRGEAELEATLKGTVNPVTEGAATCAFAWGASKTLGQLAPCEAEVPEGNAPVPVQGKIKSTEGLEPDSTYFFRLQATNKNGTNPGEESDDKELHTPGPGIHSTSASKVDATSATLNASIDPNGAPTSYYFQYGRSSVYEVQTAPAPVGSGKGDVAVTSGPIAGLSPLSEYHYRVVAVASLEVEGKQQSVSFFGPDKTFRTLGATAETLDGRRWELVSPPDKHGAQLLPIEEDAAIQAARGGGAITYVATLPTEEGVKGYIYGGVQVLSARGAEGWSSTDVPLAHASASGVPVGVGKEYRAFSADLCGAVVEEEGFGEFIPLTGEAFPPATQRTPFVRHDCTCPSAPSECFEPLLTSAPGYVDVAEGAAPFGSFPEHEGVVGASADLAHVIVNSKSALTGLKEAEGRQELYEWSADKAPDERLAPVSELPPPKEGEKEAPGENARLGFENLIARHAVSEDGSRVVWSDKESHHLYLRDTVNGKSVQLDAAEAQCLAKGECGEAETANARFQLASADGSRVLFTDSQRLTANAGKTPGEADLYECAIEEVAGAPTCNLTDLTPAPGAGKSADVQGALLGASEDGSWVYFAANGVLGDGAQRGASKGDCDLDKGTHCNLYVVHERQTHFIATVAGADYPDWTGNGGSELSSLTARVSPDGQWLSFMSQRSLTGYDNEDVTSKAPGERPDEEVFLYHAEEGGIGHLMCASCDPSGARPTGVEYAKLNGGLVGGVSVWNLKTWIAANVPGWTPYSLRQAVYQSRYLSNSGRLFFNSNDALLQEDENENQDVYEFEPPATGSCSSASPNFKLSSEGCLGLISSGKASGESAFLDASESGDDVYFLTGQALVPKDRDGALDLYDAHVCSTASPCPEEKPEPIPCNTLGGCHNPPMPQLGIFGSPPSATFSGPGNAPATSPVTPPKPPILTPKQKLAKALNACRHRYKGKAKKQRKRRQRCERQAHNRYGPHETKRAARKGHRR